MTLTTARLTLRPLNADDWPLFYALHNDIDVIEKCFDKPSEAHVRAKFNERLKPWSPGGNTPLCLVIVETCTGKEVGVTGFTSSTVPNRQEVGYLLLPNFHGRGYATESLKAVLDYAIREHRVCEFKAVVTEGNVGSEKVLEKCGFQLIEKQPDAYMIGGILYTDHHFYLNRTDHTL
ncbi:RimJ/RimL family protein N-acetyltransferase [Pseudoalteromonas sp. MBR-15]|jgi:RimJ/RimL family protein N-acetyltransferase